MQPYQRAALDLQEREEKIGRAGTYAAGAAGGLAGGALARKMIPFLNKLIPESLAIKGLSKASKNFPGFLERAKANGKSFEDVRDYLSESVQNEMGEGEEEAEIADQQDNPIFRFSRRLGKFVEDAFKVGHTLDEVAGMVSSPGNKFAKEVQHIEKVLGVSFRKLLKTLYGGGEGDMQPPRAVEESAGQPGQGPGWQGGQAVTTMQPPQGGGGGQGQQQLLAMLQKINQRMGG